MTATCCWWPLPKKSKDLLSRNTGYSEEGKQFRQRFGPLKVIEPLELLRQMAPARNLTVEEGRAEHERAVES